MANYSTSFLFHSLITVENEKRLVIDQSIKNAHHSEMKITTSQLIYRINTNYYKNLLRLRLRSGLMSRHLAIPPTKPVIKLGMGTVKFNHKISVPKFLLQSSRYLRDSIFLCIKSQSISHFAHSVGWVVDLAVISKNVFPKILDDIFTFWTTSLMGSRIISLLCCYFLQCL